MCEGVNWGTSVTQTAKPLLKIADINLLCGSKAISIGKGEKIFTELQEGSLL